ncbi:MAG: hypothetical protein VW405_13585 [Rhodospirillaceae bacterium]
MKFHLTKQTTRSMLSAIGAAAARIGRLLAMLLLSPFYVAGWLAAGVVVVWRHVRAAVVTGWEDVAGPLPSATRSASPSTRATTPRPPSAPMSDDAPKSGGAVLLAAAIIFVALMLGILLWVGLSGQVANG